MQAARTQFAVRLLPSLTDLAFLMPVVFLFGRMDGARTLLGDCDTGWHIRTGEWILANHQAPAHDIFSFSRPGQPWFAWEWLSDVLLARLNYLGGLQAVVLFSTLIIAATFAGLFLLVRRKANPVIAIAVTIIAAASSSIHWLARPHLFTLLFLVLFYAALEQVQEGRTRIAGIPILAALPAITILWTNLHGGFFVGAMTIAAFGAGDLLRSLFTPNPEERPVLWRRARNHFASAAACIAVSLINPYTYHLHVHMVQYLRDPWNAQHILEFFSPSFHGPAAPFFEAMLVLATIAAVSSLRHGNFTPAILIALWAHGGLLAGRNIPIFAIVAAPAVAEVMQRWFSALPDLNVAGWLRTAATRFNCIASETAETDAMPRWHLVSVLAIALVAAILYAPRPPEKFRSEFNPKTYPARALKALGQYPDARIFTHDEWGDYLIYTRHKVFVDGRSDFYGDDFEEKYLDVLDVKYGWEKTLFRYGVDTILMPPSAPLTGALKESSKWRVVYDDGVALVFRSTRSAGEPESVAVIRGGEGRDREVTKTQARDQHADHKTQTQNQNLGAKHNDDSAQSME
jgi:hypothetical protein